MNINICKDYTDTPGGRYIIQGDFSGEDFRNKLLKPKYIEAVEKGEKLKIDLDGGYGYGSSFLEEAFGGLIRELEENYKQALEIIELKSDDEPSLIDDITKYINDAIRKKK